MNNHTASQVEIIPLSAQAPDWLIKVDELRQLLGAPNNPELLPPHFVKTVLPKLGGQLLVLQKNHLPFAVSFLLPRDLRQRRREYTLRLHKIAAEVPFMEKDLIAAVEELVAGAVVYYDPVVQHTFVKTAQVADTVEIGAPDQLEANRIRELQRQIWGYHAGDDEDYLYPVDIHSPDFRPGTSLVARQQNGVVGFLLGFYKFAQSELPAVWQQKLMCDFCIESQLLGVAPHFRGKRIGYFLKKAQAEAALRQGIEVIQWTVDPLQYRNARLNFGELRAVATQFYSDYYPFRNELNQVASARFEITWLVATPRVRQALANNHDVCVLQLREYPEIQVVNNGWQAFSLTARQPRIAFEIPADWTALQQSDLMQAQKWRVITDQLFKQYIGTEVGKYVVTGVGESGDKKYLIAERVEPKLLAHLLD